MKSYHENKKDHCPLCLNSNDRQDKELQEILHLRCNDLPPIHDVVGKMFDSLCNTMQKKYLNDQLREHTKGLYFAERIQLARKHLQNKLKLIESNRIKVANCLLNVQQKREIEYQLNAELREKEELIKVRRDIESVLRVNLNNNLSPITFSARWRAACAVFFKFPIDLQVPKRNKTSGNAEISLVGISSICSLPLPNNGNYEGVPHEIVFSALGQVCHLMDALASLLNISLPHVLRPFETCDFAVIIQFGENRSIPLSPVLPSPLAVMSNQPLKSVQSPSTIENSFEFQPPHHSTRGNYEVDHDSWTINPEFIRGLKLLQYDLVWLCVKAGMSPEKLWPKEALLLNMFELSRYCLEMARVNEQWLHAIPSVTRNMSSDDGDSQRLSNDLSHRYERSQLRDFDLSKLKMSDSLGGIHKGAEAADWFFIEDITEADDQDDCETMS